MGSFTKKYGDFFSFETVYVLFLYAGVLKGIPVLERFTHGIDFTLALAGVGIFLAIAMCLVRPVVIYPKVPEYFLLYSLFVCWALVSYGISGTGEYAHRKILKLMLMTSWAVVAPLVIINSNERIHRFLQLMVTAGLIMAVFGLLQGSPNPSDQLGAFGTDSYQPLGRSSSAGIIILLTFLLYDPNPRRHLPYAVGIAVLMSTMLLSGARQAFVGLLVAAVALPVAMSMDDGKRIGLKRYVIAMTCVALVVGGLQVAVMPQIGNKQAEERIGKLIRIGQDDGWRPQDENRPQIMQSAWRLWTMYPVCGAGFGCYADFVSLESEHLLKWPHNLFLEILCELGLVGMALALLLLGTAFVTWLIECRRPANYIAACLGCLWLFHCTCAMFSMDINDNRISFALASMIVANSGFRQAMDRKRLASLMASVPQSVPKRESGISMLGNRIIPPAAGARAIADIAPMQKDQS